MSYRKTLTISIAVYLVFAIGHVASLGPLENTHLKIRDIYFRVRGPIVPNPQITIFFKENQIGRRAHCRAGGKSTSPDVWARSAFRLDTQFWSNPKLKKPGLLKA